MSRPLLRRTAAGLLLGGLLAAGLPAVTATASPIDDARQAAGVLRTKVDALRLQAELATEDYDAAYADLGAAVTAHLIAQHDLERAQATAGARDGTKERRVRALYMVGGASGLYASVLNAGDLNDALSRVHQVSVVLHGDQRDVAAAGTALSDRRRAEQRMAIAAATSTRLQRAVATRGDAVRALLARTDALVAQADAKVVRLAEEQRLAAEAAAARRAAIELARAQALTLPTGAFAAATPLAAAALGFAQSQLGKPYLWGATGPASFDCSGLTGAAYAAAGLTLPRTSRQQWFSGPQVNLPDLQPGDLLFWATNPADPRTIHHVALYAGDGLMIAAPHTGAVVRVEPVYLDGFIGAVRPGAQGQRAVHLG